MVDKLKPLKYMKTDFMISVIFIVVALLLMRPLVFYKPQIVQNQQFATATVYKKISQRSKTDDGYIYGIVYKYQANGKVYEKTRMNMNVEVWSPIKKGDKIEIVYNSKKANQSATLEQYDDTSEIKLKLQLFSVGLVIIFFITLMFLNSYKKAKRENNL
jgi:hypothetical protein